MTALADDMAWLPARIRRMGPSLRGPTAATGVTNLAILACNALAGIVSARALGPAGRGQLAIVMLWSALIQTAGSLGLLSSCSYYVARWPDRRPALTGWLKRIAAGQALAMTAASAAILWWLHVHLGLAPLLAVEYMTWAAVATIMLYGACYAQGSGDFRRFNMIRVVPGAVTAALMTAGVLVLRLTPAEAGAAYLLPAGGCALAAGIWLWRAGREIPVQPLSPGERRAMLSYGWRSLASFSGLTLNRSADQLALALLVPAGALGIYSVAVAASSPLPSLVASLGMVGLPTVAALSGRAKSQSTWRTMRRAAWLLVFVSPVVAAFLPWAIPAVYGAQYSAAVVPAEFLLLGAVFTALATVTDDLLRGHGHPGFVSISQGAGGAITILGTVLLAGRPLAAVAVVSSAGFLAAFALALLRLWVATRRLRNYGRHRAPRRNPGLKAPSGRVRKDEPAAADG